MLIVHTCREGARAALDTRDAAGTQVHCTLSEAQRQPRDHVNAHVLEPVLERQAIVSSWARMVLRLLILALPAHLPHDPIRRLVCCPPPARPPR